MKALLPMTVSTALFLIFTGIIPCLLAERTGDTEKKAQSIKHIVGFGVLFVFSLTMSLLM